MAYIDRDLFNFLAALHPFFAHTATYLKRRHGGESAILALFKDLTAKATEQALYRHHGYHSA